MPKIKHQPMRYSPQPMAHYKVASSIIDTPERWNLAWLSHPYEKVSYHKDPQFAVHVRRTTQTWLVGNGVDLAGQMEPQNLVGSLFNLPAPQAIHLLDASGALIRTPLWEAYGMPWLDAMRQRSFHCWYDAKGLEPDPVSPDLQASYQYNHLIKKVSKP